ncbi:MAG: hybrid sensor histidine kinase/response regulator [Burkholderiaceae bacterium]|nr:hybrid sensor histidine kinase/response regulator [Burkholderiaceae bacterium]
MTQSSHTLPGSGRGNFDSGPLSWVMEEIREALGQSRAALFDALAKGDDAGTTQLNHALAFLHQAHGALQIIDVNGVTILTDAIEDILRRMSSKDIPLNRSNATVIEQAYVALIEYLQELLSGDEQQPLRLFPYYRDLQELRGSGRIHPADLFFPEIEIAPANIGALAESYAPPSSPDFASLRRRFEKTLLPLLVYQGAPADIEAAAALRDIVAEIFAAQDSLSGRGFWFAMYGFADMLSAMTQPPSIFDKQVCGRMNRQIKLLAEGSSSVSERLLVDALYCLSCGEQKGVVASKVREAFQLADAIPADLDRKRYGQTDSVALGMAKASLSQAKNEWNRVTKGDANAAKSFATVLRQLTEATVRLNTPALEKLFSAIASASAPAENGMPISDNLALEIATGLLFSENTLMQLNRLPEDFPQRVDTLIGRIRMVADGKERPATAQWMDSLAQQSQQQQTVSVLATEMESGLRHIERILDEYHIDHTKHEALAEIDPLLHQISGVLSILGQEDAMQAVLHTQSLIQHFRDANASREDNAAFASIPEAVTQNITALGFFVEMLPQHPETARNRFVFDQEQGILHANLLEKAAPRQSVVRTADAAFDPVLDIEENAPAQPAATTQPPPAQATAEAQPVSDEEIDAELLDIFMSEAEEVLDFVKQTVPEARNHKDDHEQLSTLRRSFHTLKGSGRMVGLTAFAEAAYSIEQVMNLWLAEARSGTPDLFSLLDKAAQELGEWVDDLKTSGKSARTPVPLCDAAERVKQGEPFRFVDAAVAPATSDKQGEATSAQTEPEEIVSEPDIYDTDVGIAANDKADNAGTVTPVINDTLPTTPPQQLRSNIIEFPGTTVPTTVESDNIKRIGSLEISVPLYNIFVTEADDILRFLAQDFSEWRHEPSRAVSQRAVQAVHTLAGISATVGFTTLHDVAHVLEVCLETLEYQPMALSASALDTLHSCVEQMKQMQQQIAIGEMPMAQPGLIQSLRGLQLEAATPAATAPTMVEADVQETAPASATSLPAEELFAERAASESVADVEETDDGEDDDEGVVRLHDALDPDLLPVFIDEGRDLLPQIGESLRNWLNNPSEANFAPEILRHLHTAKGSARMAGAMEFGQHLHMMESHIEKILHTGNITSAMLEELQARHDHSLQLFDSLLHPEKEKPKPFKPAQQQPADATPDGQVLSAPLASTPQSEQMHSLQANAPIAQPATAGPVARVRVRADVLDRLVNQAGEVSIARSKIENEVGSLRQSLADLTDNLSRLRTQLREVEIQAESQIASRMAQATDREFDPLEFDRFSRLQELTRMMTESVDDVASIQDSLLRTVSGATSDLETQAQLTRSLQQDLMQVRMVPFASIAERLYQVTRQTAKEVDKPVNLDILGTTVEIDRSVLERMVGPLEHLIRNAIVHGIEPRTERKPLGKRETGELMLEIRQEGNEVVLRLSDDGKGLDWNRISERAQALGLISSERVLTQSEMEDLIFQSGFSTANEVTTVAGRGVGMDVVRSETTSLGGRIIVHSETGKGTTFTINLPLTLAVSSVVLLSAGDKTYAIPSVLVEQVQQLQTAAVTEAKRAGGIAWMGERIPVYFLSALLGDTKSVPAEQPLTPVVMLRSGNDRIALQVDEVIGNREVVVKNIGPQLARMIGIAGATVLGSGDIVLILNPVPLAHRILSDRGFSAPIIDTTVPLYAGKESTGAQPEQQAELTTQPTNATSPSDIAFVSTEQPASNSHKKNIVMVVDDSLTVRRVTQRFLQREGYQVVLAKDGIDALEKLQEVQPDVMLVDIEMPRMDGFDLIRNVRSDSRISKTPIIMITSRTASKHRNYAMELGANEYYGKPFHEQQLLESIEEFVGKDAMSKAPHAN